MNWGTVAKLGAIGAAPFTGGASLAALPAISSIAGGAAKGMADQRAQENAQTQERNRLMAQLFGITQNANTSALENSSRERLGQGGLDLDQRKFALAAPGTRASNAVRGSLIQNLQPVSFSGLPSRISNSIPHMTGGLTPAAISPEARAAGGELTRQSVLELLKGDQFTPQTPTNFQGGVLPLPQMEALKQSGLLEKILGGLGLGGSLLSGLAPSGYGSRGSQGEAPNDTVGWG